MPTMPCVDQEEVHGQPREASHGAGSGEGRQVMSNSTQAELERYAEEAGVCPRCRYGWIGMRHTLQIESCELAIREAARCNTPGDHPGVPCHELHDDYGPDGSLPDSTIQA